MFPKLPANIHPCDEVVRQKLRDANELSQLLGKCERGHDLQAALDWIACFGQHEAYITLSTDSSPFSFFWSAYASKADHDTYPPRAFMHGGIIFHRDECFEGKLSGYWGVHT